MSYRLRQGGNLASLVLMVFMIGSLLMSSVTSVLDLAQIQRATETDVNTVIQYGSLPDAREKRVVERRVAQAASADSLTAACQVITCSEPAGNEKVAAKLASIVEHGVEWGINPYKGHAGYYFEDGIGVFGAPPPDTRDIWEKAYDSTVGAALDAGKELAGMGSSKATPNPLAVGEMDEEDSNELRNVYNKMFGMMYYFSATRVLVSAAGIGSQVWHVLRITARGIGAFFLYVVFFSAKFVQILGLYLYKFIDVFNIFRYINIARLGGVSEEATSAVNSAENAPEFFKAMQELLQHTYNIGTVVALFVFAVGLFAVVVGINFGSGGSGRSGAAMSLVRRLLVSVLTMGGAIAALSGLVTSFSLQMGQQADDMGIDNTIQGLITDTEGFITAAYYPMGPELAALTDSSYLAEASKILEDTDKSVDERMTELKALETRKVSENADEKEKAAKEYLEAYYQFSMPNLTGTVGKQYDNQDSSNTVGQFDYADQLDNVPSLDTMAGAEPILNRSMTDGAVAAINFSAGHVIDGADGEGGSDSVSNGMIESHARTLAEMGASGEEVQSFIQSVLISTSTKGAQDIISGTSAELLNGWSSGHQFTGGDLKARYGEHAMIVPVGYLYVENGHVKSPLDAGVLNQWTQVNHYSYSIPGGVPGAFLRWAKAVTAMLFKVLFALAIYAIMFGYIMDMMRRVLTKFWGALYFGSLGAFMVLIASVIVMMAQIMMSRIVLSMFVSLMNSPKQIIAAVANATGDGGVILNTISLGALLFDLFGTLLIGYLGFVGLLKFNKNFGQAIGEASQTVANKLAGGFGADTTLAGNAFDGRSSLGNRFSEGIADKVGDHGKKAAVIGGVGAGMAGYGAARMLGDSADDIENRINGRSDTSAMDDTVSDNPDDQVPEGSAGSLSAGESRDQAVRKENEKDFQEGTHSMSRKQRRQLRKQGAAPLSSVGQFNDADEAAFVASAVHSDVAEAQEDITQRRNTRFSTATGAVSSEGAYGEDGQAEALAAQQAEQAKYEEEKSEVYKSLVKDIRSGGVSLNGNAQLADVAQDLHTGLDVTSESGDHMTNLHKMDVLNKSIAAQESYESAVGAQGAALSAVDEAVASKNSTRIQAAQQDLIMATSSAQIAQNRAEAAHADLQAAGYEGATDGQSLRQSRNEAVETVISQDVLWESKQGSSAAPDVQLDGQEATQSVDVTQEVAGQEAQAPVGFGGGQMDIRDNLDQTTYVERDTVEASGPQGGVVGSDSTRESVSRASASGVTSVNDTVQVNRQEEEVSASHAPRSSSASGVTSVNDTVQVNRQEDVQSTTSRPQSSASGVTSVNDTVQVNREEQVQGSMSRPQSSASGVTSVNDTVQVNRQEDVQSTTSRPMTSASGGDTTRTETTTVRSNEERVQGSTSGPVTTASGGDVTRNETTTVRSNEERVQGSTSGPVTSASGGNTTRTETTTVRSNEERVQGSTSRPVNSSSGGNTTRTETTTVRSNEEHVQGSTSRPVNSASGGNTTRTETTKVRGTEERVQGTSSRPQSSASGGNTTRTETTKVRSNEERVQGSTSRPQTSASSGNATRTETTTVNHREVSNRSGSSAGGRHRRVTDMVGVDERVNQQSDQENTRSGVRGRRDRVENVTDVDESVSRSSSSSSSAAPAGGTSSNSQGPTQANNPFSGTSLERGQIDKD